LSGADAATTGSPESDRHSPPADAVEQRGSINADGSVNLGFRLRNEQGRTLLPEPTSTKRTLNGQQLPPSDLTAYSSSSNPQGHQHETPESLHNDNRLPPMTSYPSPGRQQRSSLSPSSFLSPTRKRSFSAAEFEPPVPSLADPASGNSKRLSSIKSILNPGFSDSDSIDSRDRDMDSSYRRDNRSPSRYPGIGSAVGSPTSAGAGSYVTSPAPSGPGSALNSGRDAQSESERNKLERREMLQREAERMREALKAKEKELAELGLGE